MLHHWVITDLIKHIEGCPQQVEVCINRWTYDNTHTLSNTLTQCCPHKMKQTHVHTHAHMHTHMHTYSGMCPGMCAITVSQRAPVTSPSPDTAKKGLTCRLQLDLLTTSSNLTLPLCCHTAQGILSSHPSQDERERLRTKRKRNSTHVRTSSHWHKDTRHLHQLS